VHGIFARSGIAAVPPIKGKKIALERIGR